jgi:Bacterial PH domain
MTEVFEIVPVSAKPLWFLAAVCAVLLVVIAALGFTAYAARHSRVELGEHELRLVGDFWGRSIPLAALQLERASVVDLARSSEHAPRLRTFGTGLPGYASGWFRLRNGEKALAYLIHRESVAYIPTSLGYSLLLSVERPQQLLARLRERTGR